MSGEMKAAAIAYPHLCACGKVKDEVLPQGYPGMYYCQGKEVCSSVAGEIVYVKEDFVDSIQEKLDIVLPHTELSGKWA